MKAARLFLVFLTLAAALNLSLGQTAPRTLDRGRLPAALRNVPLERLSSGALLRLDLDGDLVETPEARARRTNAAALTPGQSEAVTVALDQRVGPNIRLGDDPAALPSSTRAQAEPHIARALSDPDFLLATFQEGRLATGGAVDCGFSVTHDGGLTWTRALIPNLTHASGGPYDRATDPVAAIALNGTAYLNTLGLSNTAQIGTLLVSRSTDGGNTFAPPVIAYNDPSGNVFVDKNWMTVNTFAATPTKGRLVATFTLFSNTGGLSHPIMRVFSDNGGSTWSSPAFVHAASTQAQGSQPTFLRDGRLVVPYWNFNGTDNFADDFLELVVSDDGGNTFGAPKFITPVQIYDQPSIRDGAFLPAAATDRNTGALFVTYQAVHNGAPRIMFTKSANAGDTWTTPIPISNNPASSGVFNPAIASSPDGQTLTVAFYDLRNHPGSTTLVDMYLAQSFDGGATWQPNIRLTSKSSDVTLAPNTGTASAPAYMLGDYLGIAGTPNPNVPAVPVWVDTRTGNPDPWVTRVGISATPNFTSWQAARLSLGQINNPALGGEAGDADGDGEDNLSEFRRGTDPNNAASVVHTSRPVNISTRARIENGENVLIGGFIITGPDPKRVILRAVGPSLTAFGVFGALADPTLELVPPSGAHVFNDDWRATSAAMIEATGLAPQDDRESAIVRTLAPGAYTAIMRSKTSASGIGIVEVYDLAPAAKARFANLSSRARVGVGDRVMIGGFIVGAGGGSNGAGSVRVVARGIGPSLGQSGVADPLQNPELLVYDVNANLVGANDNWRETQEAELQALNLAPADNREAALAITLRRGNYTAIVRGKGGTTGVAVVEVYLIP